MKNEIVQEAHFCPEDVKAMYAYIEAIKTLNLKPEVELGLSRSIHNTYVFRVKALKPVEVGNIYVGSGTVDTGHNTKAPETGFQVISVGVGGKIGL